MAELGLLAADVGRVAVPAAAVNDVAVWTLLAVGVALGGPARSPLTPLWVLLSGAAFGVAMLTLARVLITVVARRAERQVPNPKP
jgi:Kef-type K+ transport system membrane component KefB